MKKKTVILALALLLATAAKAQIYVTEGDDNMRPTGEAPSAIWPNLPNDTEQGYDGYTPIGSGILLLAALGGAYLIRKRKGDSPTGKGINP